jgi:hypothetical protein
VASVWTMFGAGLILNGSVLQWLRERPQDLSDKDV